MTSRKTKWPSMATRHQQNPKWWIQLLNNLSRACVRVAKHAILYVQAARPRLRKTLKSAWAVLRAWEEHVPGSFRPPLPLTLLAAMTCQSRLQAARDDSRSSSSIWHVFGTLLNVGYFALLRPGELLKLKTFDIMLPNSVSLRAPFEA